MSRVKVVGFLQNAWSGMYAGERWPRPSWLRALGQSRSGQRLAVLTAAATKAVGDDAVEIEFVWDNTTPIVGPTPDSVVPPDPAHIAGVLAAHSPLVVFTFGGQATRAVSPLWGGSLLAVPHPASRVLTNALYRAAGTFLARHLTASAGPAAGRYEFRQLRGRHRRVAMS